MPQFVFQYHEIVITGLALFLFYIFGPVIRDKIRGVFGKDTEDIVTLPMCRASQKECAQARVIASTDFQKEVRENFAVIKGVLLVLASGQKPDIDKLTELFR